MKKTLFVHFFFVLHRKTVSFKARRWRDVFGFFVLSFCKYFLECCHSRHHHKTPFLLFIKDLNLIMISFLMATKLIYKLPGLLHHYVMEAGLLKYL